MTFEEDFPGLKGKKYVNHGIGTYSSVELCEPQEAEPIEGKAEIVFKRDDIAEFCLDKSKVKQAIEELKERCSHSHHVNKVRLLINVLNELIRELGL